MEKNTNTLELLKKNKRKSDTRKFSTELPNDLLQALDAFTSKHNITKRGVITVALIEFLSREDESNIDK